MRVAGAEPITRKGLVGQNCYRLHRASGRPAVHELDQSAVLRVEILDHQAVVGTQLALKVRSCFQVAQMMRASLLASATAALL